MGHTARPSLVGAEAALVLRVAAERKQRGWKPEGLARRMTDEGCPMTQSTIWKIENHSRRVNFDEAVAFAKVLELRLEDLCLPPAVAASEPASRLMRKIRRLEAQEARARIAAEDAMDRLFDVLGSDSDQAISDSSTAATDDAYERHLNQVERLTGIRPT